MEIQLDEKGYRFLSIQEYKGKYRLEVGKTGKDGKWYAERIKSKQWNAEKKVFEFTEKESNLSIPLGEKEKAFTIAEAITKEFEPF